MAAKQNGTTALTKYDERLAALAKTAKQAVSKVGGGNFISLRGGIMTWQGAAVPDNKMRCIVIDAIAENQFYEGAFDPEAFAAPTCYAFGRDPNSMAPDPEHVAAPVSESCHGCAYNEWGSADVGKGKACKEVQRLALITEGDLENEIESATVAYLKVPVTSVKGWAGYVRKLADVYNKPPLAFITEISVVKENTNKLPGWHLEFNLISPVEEADQFEALMNKYEEVSPNIGFPYAKVEAAAPAVPVKRPSARPTVNRVAPAVPTRAGAKGAKPKY